MGKNYAVVIKTFSIAAGEYITPENFISLAEFAKECRYVQISDPLESGIITFKFIKILPEEFVYEWTKERNENGMYVDDYEEN